MKALKITNPEYLGLLAESIQKFVEKVQIPGIRYETLYTYFVESIRNGFVQKQMHGSELEEFWVVMDDDEKPSAWGHWFKRGVPYNATVECDYVFSWGDKRQALRCLIDELEQFAARHRSPLIIGTSVNTIVFNHLVKVGKMKGYEVLNINSINFIARKR